MPGNQQTTTARRELAIDTMASWALEGLEPDAATLSDIRELVEGRMTREDFLRRTRALASHD